MLVVDIRARVGGFNLQAGFSAHNGEMMALFGPSGTGKSLTLRCLAGLLRPEAGQIMLNDRPLFDAAAGVDLPPRLRRMGYVPQQYALFPHMTVAENIAYSLPRRRDGRQKALIGEMIQLMRLEGLENRRSAQLSGGQQQRVALGRALISEPELLLLDEPFGSLDGSIRNRLQNELIALQQRIGIPALLITHDLAEAYTLCDRLAVFNDGRVLQVGPKDEVLRRPATRSVAKFVGTKNIFSGRVIGSNRGETIIAWGQHRIHAPGDGFTVGQKVTFCIRPEEMMIIRPDRPLKAGLDENMVACTLVRQIDRAATHSLFFKAHGVTQNDYDLEVLLPQHAWQRLKPVVGQATAISLKGSAIHIIPEIE